MVTPANDLLHHITVHPAQKGSGRQGYLSVPIDAVLQFVIDTYGAASSEAKHWTEVQAKMQAEQQQIHAENVAWDDWRDAMCSKKAP